MLAMVATAALCGCSSTVTYDGAAAGAPPPKLANPNVAAVDIRLSDQARKLQVDNLAFDPEALRRMVERTLDLNGLLAKDAGQRLAIEITDMRVRHIVAAVMLGALSGSDNVTGNVQVTGADGAVVAKFGVSASYAFGGLGGGQDSTRIGWLYEEFARQTAAALTGKVEVREETPLQQQEKQKQSPKSECRRTGNGIWVGCN